MTEMSLQLDREAGVVLDAQLGRDAGEVGLEDLPRPPLLPERH